LYAATIAPPTVGMSMAGPAAQREQPRTRCRGPPLRDAALLFQADRYVPDHAQRQRA